MQNSNVKKKVKDARIKFFRKDYGLEFFGVLAYKFQWNVTKMSPMAEGGVTMKPGEDAASDGKIHVNEEYISCNDYNSGHLIALISHELMHILDKHAIRRKNRSHQLWNVAGDHVIDRELKKVFQGIPDDITFYQDRYNIIERLHSEQPNCSVEDAYDWLKQNYEQNKITIKINGNGDPSSGQGDQDNQDGSQTLTITDEQTGQQINVTLDSEGQVSSDSADGKTKEQVENIVAQARALYEQMKNKGSIPGSMQEQLDEILKVEIPWEELLEKAIKKNTILKPDERSWRELNKYFYPQGITLPGYSMTEDNDAVGHLIIAADSSGSISPDNLKQWASVLMDSMKYFDKIYLLVHDIDVHQVIEFERDDTQKFYEFIENQGFQGRGGTSHKPVFDYIEENHWADVDARDNLSMVISLTDGMSDIENIYKEYDFIKNNIPIVFTVCTNWTFEPDIGDFQVINIKDGK